MTQMRTRLWDKDFNCLYDSETDSRTVEEFMTDQDEVYYTKSLMTGPTCGQPLWHHDLFYCGPGCPWWPDGDDD